VSDRRKSSTSLPSLQTMGPTTKRRRFQPPITSFFTSASSSSDIGQNLRDEQESLSFPHLSHEIQSSLLTVGMRIRKSVPEGYKTHQTINSRDSTNSGPHNHSSLTRNTASSTAHGGYAELAPFCGLHKIGGMAVQTMPASTEASRYLPWQRRAEQIEEADPWSLPSSQDSTYNSTPLAPSNKRTFASDQDEKDGEDVTFDSMGQKQSSHPFSPTRISPLNALFPAPVSLSPKTRNMGVRAYAIPRSRTSKSKDRRPVLEGQENLGLSHKACSMPASFPRQSNGDVDFEEADFLEAREDVDVDELMDGY
jgi:Ribonucleotide reductase inhibitor